MPGEKKNCILDTNALFSNLAAPTTFIIIPTKPSNYLLIATCIMSLNHRGLQFNIVRNKKNANFFKKGPKWRKNALVSV